METQEFLTQEKKEQLENELHHLKTTVRSEILERLAFAKSLGDLSENAEYHSSKDAQGKNEARIAQIEVILKNAVVVEANSDGVVGLGSTVTITRDDGTEKKYQIVGNEEADFSAGKISFQSPLGSALIDKKEDDQISVETPKGVTRYTINNVI
ncbi:transcription elongation factor GreA [Candidatus Campbellbacteria bacterium]|nr:transcription elongation factor GreA [Candidatus Campbellbacteria bacterium]|tara:strand:- start:1531 stop:1992 length:462 start_codon:yes stop_codon:yes gene_type:complete